MSRRRFTMAATLAGSALLAVVAPSMAGGEFGATTVLRTAPSGSHVTAGDIAAKGSVVIVGWQEDPVGGGRSVRIRWSTNGGASFQPAVRLDTRPQREVQVDTCSGWVWATSGLHDPDAPANEWLVALDGHAVSDPFYEQSVITTDGLARKPDVACVGTRRLAVAWFGKVGGGYHVRLFARGVIPNPKGDEPPEVRLDLGSGVMAEGLAIAASSDRIYVAWFDGDQLKLKRFDVGAAPNFPVTALATQVIAEGLTYGQHPELGVEGGRVVLAYTNRADLVARVSTNGGASWGAQRRLVDAPFPSEVLAEASNADVKGSRLIVSGVIVGGIFEEFSGEGYVYRSTNNGASWARPAGSTKNGGTAIAAYASPGGTARIVETWDQWIDDPSIQRLRFQRQS